MTGSFKWSQLKEKPSPGMKCVKPVIGRLPYKVNVLITLLETFSTHKGFILEFFTYLFCQSIGEIAEHNHTKELSKLEVNLKPTKRKGLKVILTFKR
ncbi:hypothetical protein Anas_04429 [Armadillidium nasatum]|uniref:Uncharacterized protein n=1 Tax=Armadillidium nasatum TaxID=96803 RepID=A0A5N5TG72_9CRUS|nr:hypothetical protein Anas_04429 [Armadillidium nasatum]